MNNLKQLVVTLPREFPNVKVTLDEAETPKGSTWIDLQGEGLSFSIEARPGMGFGLYTREEEGFGSGPDEIYRELQPLLKRLNELFKHEGQAK